MASRESTVRRCLTFATVALAVLLVGYLCFAVLPTVWQLPVLGTPEYVQPAEPVYDTEPVDEPAQQARFDDDNLLVKQAVAQVETKAPTEPFVFHTTSDGQERTALVVPPGDRIHLLPELAQRFPAMITAKPDGQFVLNQPLISVATHLQVGGPEVKRVLLRSDATGYAFITPVRGSLELQGSGDRPVEIASLDPATQLPDATTADGRAYLRALGAHLTLQHATVTDLGFLTGAASGVSWMRNLGQQPTGGAEHTVFARNYFGAYSSGAQALVFDHADFRDNRVYGFDPHTDSNNLVLRNSSASGNGKHGVIFSKGCHDAVITDTTSTGNGGAGFFIDDGNPDRGPVVGSDRNLLRNLTATGNNVAVIVEGGTDNVIDGLTATNNAYGVWIKQAAQHTRISGIAVTATAQTGIRIDPGTTGTTITRATVDGAPIGIEIDDSTDNMVADSTVVATTNGLRLGGDQTGNTFTHVRLAGAGWNPVVSSPGEPIPVPAGVDIGGWRVPPGTSLLAVLITRVLQPLGLFVWACLLLPPILLWIPARRRRRAKQNQLVSLWWDGDDVPTRN